ncbi:penicillin acylase family protein [Rhodoferax sp. WC2427]|uniref:penicillin acylase family protein n=1 Tax=Rhodoferax sp. WC2427 TaxID=3234144 RepID=UPI00346693A8
MQLTTSMRGIYAARIGLITAAAAVLLTGCLPTDYAASIRTTSYGVPHIVADTFTGAGYGYGYAFAQDNFCLFAEELVTLHGERAKYFGAAGGYLGQLGTVFGNVDSDFFYKLVLSSDQAARFKAGSSRATRELADGFATGYNRYLSDTGLAKLPVACRGKAWVKPMTEEDAFLRFSQAAMTGSSLGFIGAIGSAVAPAAAVAKAATTTTMAKAKVPAAPFEYAQSPVLMAFQSLRDHTIGSNGLGLGRNATQSGKGLLMGNPHFPWWGALRLNQVHITVAKENYDVMGATLLGVPLPLIGFNDKVAWTHTFSTDNRFTVRYLAIDPSNPTRYLKDGKSIAMKAVPLTVSALGADGNQVQIKRTLYTTEYGPMLKDTSFAWTTGSGYALQDANATNYQLIDQVILNGKSTSVDSLRLALATYNAMPWVNTIAADQAGDALYANYSVAANVPDAQLAACVPPPFQPLMASTGVVVMAGTTAACDWSGSIPAAGRPWVKRADYAMNSNDSHWWPSLNTYLSGFAKIIATGPNAEATAQNNRTRTGHAMVRDRLAGTDGQGGYRFTLANLQQLYLKSRFFKAEKWLPGFVSGCLASPGATPAALDACAVLQAWSTAHTPSSQGVVLFDELYAALGELNDASWWSVPFNPADPQETPRGTANQAAAMAQLETLVASSQFNDPLKRRARTQDVQLLQRAEGVLAVPGGRSTYNNWAGVRTQVAPGQFIYTADPATNAGAFGNSYIQFVTWDSAGPVAEGILTYSQSSDPTSSHFSDQTRKYAAGEWVKLPYTDKQIKADPNYSERVLYETPLP